MLLGSPVEPNMSAYYLVCYVETNQQESWNLKDYNWSFAKNYWKGWLLKKHWSYFWMINTTILEFVFSMFVTDMDDTLYPLSSGLNLACRKNIQGMTSKQRWCFLWQFSRNVEVELFWLQITCWTTWRLRRVKCQGCAWSCTENMEQQWPVWRWNIPDLVWIVLSCFFCLRFISLIVNFQALGYEFDNDEFHAYVHGRLPYDTLKPDMVLRNLLLSMPPRKIVFTKNAS